MMRWLAHLRKPQARDAAREYDGTAFLDKLASAPCSISPRLSAAPGPVRWHYQAEDQRVSLSAIVDGFFALAAEHFQS
jgi:hypothetical protein